MNKDDNNDLDWYSMRQQAKRFKQVKGKPNVLEKLPINVERKLPIDVEGKLGAKLDELIEAQNKTNFYLRFCAIAAFAIVLYTTINWFMYGHWWFVPMKFTPLN
jgi:hypothetical protein